MRSNSDFIELTGKNDAKILFNKNKIMYVTEDDNETTRIVMEDGDRELRVVVKETYDDVSSELLWGFDPSNIYGGEYNVDLNTFGGIE